MWDVELTKRQHLHPNATTSNHTISTATDTTITKTTNIKSINEEIIEIVDSSWMIVGDELILKKEVYLSLLSKSFSLYKRII